MLASGGDEGLSLAAAAPGGYHARWARRRSRRRGRVRDPAGGSRPDRRRRFSVCHPPVDIRRHGVAHRCKGDNGAWLNVAGSRPGCGSAGPSARDGRRGW